MVSERWRRIYIILGLMLIAELAGLFVNSGNVKGILTRADRLRRIAIAESDDCTILPGDIYDRNGQVITTANYKKVIERNGKDGEKTVTKQVTEYSDGKAFSQLIGYTGNRVLSLLADSDEDVVGLRNDARLMAFLDEEYWGPNGIYSTTDINGTKGQSAELTIDSDLQIKVFELLSEEMDNSECMGSAVVMNAKTGELLADVSFPAYDFNDLDSALKQMQHDAKTSDLEPGYPVTYKNPVTPGSIFKILMAVALIDHGMEDYTAVNTSYTMESGWTCYAGEYDNGSLRVYEGDEIGLEYALNISSNVFFSRAALALGKNKLRETAEKFMFYEDASCISLDFGDVCYNWDLNVSNDVLAQTGFGQGKTEWTTVCAAMVTEAIANDGKLMKPYMIKRLIDAEGNTVYEGKPEMLSQATCKKTAKKVRDMMRSTAIETSRPHGYVREVFDMYDVAGKTGTAENGDKNETNNSWFVSLAPVDDPEYVVVVNQCRTDKYGSNMMETTAKIYEYLFSNAQL